MKLKLGFVQRRMKLEKQKIIMGLSVAIMVILFFTSMTLLNYTGYLFGLKDLDTNEKINRFYHSKHYLANLHYEQVVDTKKYIQIETTQKKEWVMVVAQGGMVANLPETKTTKNYRVYLLESKDNIVIFCCNHKEVDLSNKVVKVSNQYKKDKVNEHIVKQLEKVDKPVYVFYSVPVSNISNIVVEIGIVLVLWVIYWMISHAKILQKNSMLGKRIQEFGKDYETVVKEINEQVKEPIYQTGNVIITKDYVILLQQKNTDIIPIKKITSITSKPSEKYPDEVIHIELIEQDKTYCFDVYEKETEIKIINNIQDQL